jgi:peptidyl-prolyl cis-trans isomerase D
MALINKIREKTGLTVGIVAFGLILFLVGGDLLGPNSVLLGNRVNEVGEIAGEDIRLEDYQRMVEELKYTYSLNTGRNPTENEMNSIRQQAWDMMIARVAFQKQYDELGLTVTEEELMDMVHGRNITPEIAQAFADPETGEVDRNAIINYLQNLSQMPPQQQEAWFAFERNLAPSRLRLKFDNLILKSSFATTAEARQEFESQNAVAEVKYLYIPYHSVSDTLVNVSDAELKDHLKDNKKRFKVEESRSIEYVTFNVRPSSADSAFVREEMQRLKEEFKTIENDSTFARRHSDSRDYYGTYAVANLPDGLRANVDHLNVGDVKGPYWENNNYVLYKVSGLAKDSVASARASHILIKPAGKDNPRQEAENILRQLQRGADFAELARQHSEDASSRKGGDLGWFTKGKMVQPFEDAVFGATKPGLINRLVETQYGFHIIKVTEPATDKAFKVASIEREMAPSEETRNEAYRRADMFAANVSNRENFIANAEAQELKVVSAERLGKNDRRVNNLADAREVVRWLYNDASVGKVSPVFEVENDYVIAVMTNKVDAGTAPLSQVRDEILVKVRNEKKGAHITKTLQGFSGTLDEIANAYGTDARVYSSSDLKFTSTSLPGAGFAPLAIGRAFALNTGDRSIPIKEESGIVVMELVNKVPAGEPTDLAGIKEQIVQRQKSRASYNISEAIKEKADIKDERYRFY